VQPRTNRPGEDVKHGARTNSLQTPPIDRNNELVPDVTCYDVPVKMSDTAYGPYVSLHDGLGRSWPWSHRSCHVCQSERHTA
jgi:hypothetical protein